MIDSTVSPAPHRLRLAATFTAAPLAAGLAFWSAELGLELEPEFAPYGQVFQELLREGDGTRVLLLRTVDWLTEPGNGDDDRLRDLLVDLAAAVREAVERRGEPVIVVFCPAAGDSPRTLAAERRFADTVRNASGVRVIDSWQVRSWYATASWHPPYTERLGAVPYTDQAYAARATDVARCVHAAVAPRPKVIAVDCDNTIWDGEVAEGAITVPAARRELQSMLIEQMRAGRLICLCSRNAEADIVEVLTNHPDMVLRPEHVTAVRANWRPKSQNLRSLAEELGVGLDSFLFLDDDPLQVAEVRTGAPEVTALRLPADAGAAVGYLRHCWPLDVTQVTAEDADRTERYRDNRLREAIRRESGTLAQFLAKLDLRVTVREPQRHELDRVAQLTQRTNQFNLSGVRRTTVEVSRLPGEGLGCLVVEARDRFGSYGLAGLLIFRTAGEALIAETFLLSCRALGRGVEHRMLAHLGDLAGQHGLREVRLPFRATDRNIPAAEFLDTLPGRWDESVLVLDAAAAAATRYAPQQPTGDRPAPRAPRSGHRTPAAAPSALIDRIATELATPSLVAKAAAAWRSRFPAPIDRGHPGTGPCTPTEARVMRLWQDLVPSPRSVHDDFFELGGDSLTALLFLGRALDEFGVELPADTMFASPLTVAGVSTAIEDALRLAGDRQ
jgi:FkbH-like protein